MPGVSEGVPVVVALLVLCLALGAVGTLFLLSVRMKAWSAHREVLHERLRTWTPGHRPRSGGPRSTGNSPPANLRRGPPVQRAEVPSV